MSEAGSRDGQARERRARTVVVAGAGGRLGGFVVRELLRRGHRVGALSRDAARLGELGGGERLAPLVASASDAGELAGAAAALARRGWAPDGLVVCVGGWWQDGPVLGVGPGEWEELFRSHLLAHLLVVRQFAPSIAAADDGAIVLTGGIGTEEVVPGAGPISIFGAAQRAFLLTLRAEASVRARFHEVAIMGPLAEDERNDEGERPVPGPRAASAIADTLAGRHGTEAIVRVHPGG